MNVQYLNGRKLFVIPQFLTPEECAAFVERSEHLGYADALINTSFGPLLRKDVRDNQRILVDDPALAASWWDRAKGLLVAEWFGWTAVGLNERFRFYRYDPGQRFAPHMDGCFTRDTGEQSHFTFLVYLNDGFAGGETAFHEGRASPGVLESADALYNRRDAARALLAYQRIGLQTGDAHVRREARYKEGLCLIALRRAPEAVPVFEAVAAAAGQEAVVAVRDRWPLLADCQLVLLNHRQNTAAGRARAAAILDKLALRHGDRAGEFAALVPYNDCDEIARDLSHRGINYFTRPPADLVRDCERAARTADLFQPEPLTRLDSRISLVKAYRLAGRQRQALEVTEELLRNQRQYCRLEYYFGKTIFHNHCWLVRRRRGGTREDLVAALKELDLWLFTDSKAVRRDRNYSAYALLSERARLHAALGEWDAAEKDLDLLLREQEKSPFRAYMAHAEACLLRGFLRERRGDDAGALRAWQQGLWSDWNKNNPDNRQPRSGGGYTLLHLLILGSLTGELSDRETDDALIQLFTLGDGLASPRDSNSPVARLAKMLDLRPAVFREMWRTPRGREWARRIAFRDLGYADYVRVPIFLCAAEYAHQAALPGKLSPEQDELIWKWVQDSHAAFLAGQIKPNHLLALGSVWKGLNIPGFGWTQVARALPPAWRGPTAYLFGHRYLRLGKPKEAAAFFRTARDDAPANSALRRLARAELERLKGS